MILGKTQQQIGIERAEVYSHNSVLVPNGQSNKTYSSFISREISREGLKFGLENFCIFQMRIDLSKPPVAIRRSFESWSLVIRTVVTLFWCPGLIMPSVCSYDGLCDSWRSTFEKSLKLIAPYLEPIMISNLLSDSQIRSKDERRLSVS